MRKFINALYDAEINDELHTFSVEDVAKTLDPSLVHLLNVRGGQVLTEVRV